MLHQGVAAGSPTVAERLFAAFTPRIQACADVDAGIILLREFAEALARSNAELVYLKLKTEPGWTRPAAQHLVDHVVRGSLIVLTDAMHGLGGTLTMAEDLGRAHADAYGARLRELEAGVAFSPRGGAGPA